jgi:hypothetical protein
MTLIEVLVALTVGAVVLGTGLASVRTVADNRGRAHAVLAESTRAAAVRRTLTGWLMGTHLDQDGRIGFRGVDGRRGAQPDDELSFLTETVVAGSPTETRVTLRVDGDPSTPERGLVATLQPLPVGTERRLVLDSAATGLDLRFLSGIAEEPVWLPSWISASVLPRAVELRVTGDSLAPLVRLPMRVALGELR